MTNFKPKTFKYKKKSWTNFKGLCKGCGVCIAKCPQKALKWSKEDTGYYSNLTPEVDIKKCIACGICELHCPDCAIKVEKKK